MNQIINLRRILFDTIIMFEENLNHFYSSTQYFIMKKVARDK